MMTRITLLFLIIFVVGCVGQKDDSSILGNKSVYLANDKESNKLFNQQFANSLDLLLEKPMSDYMDTNEFYRLILLPSYSPPFSIRITTKQGGNKELVFKDSKNGELITEMIKSLNTQSLDSLSYYFDQAEFWDLDNENTLCDGADGALFIIEGSQSGESNTLLRWSPGICKLGNADALLKIMNYMVSLVDTKLPEDLSIY